MNRYDEDGIIILLFSQFQAFFTKLYSPDKEIFPDEIDFVEKIAKGMVVSTVVINHIVLIHLMRSENMFVLKQLLEK